MNNNMPFFNPNMMYNPFPEMPNQNFSYNFPNPYNAKISELEEKIKNLESRLEKLEKKLNINDSPYQSSLYML